MGEGVGEDQVHIGLVAQDDVVEELEAELGKFDVFEGNCLDLDPLLLGQRPAPAAGDAGHGVDMASAQHLDDVMVAHTGVDDLLADLHPHLVDHAQDVALGLGRIRADHKVRSAQGIEVGGVVGDVEGHVEKLPQLLHRGRWLDMIEGVQSLGGGHVVGLWADAADTVGDAGHLLGGTAHAELLEAPQFGDLEVGVGHIALFVQEDLDLAVAFQTCDGIDCDSFHRAPPPFPLTRARRRIEWAMLNR